MIVHTKWNCSYTFCLVWSNISGFRDEIVSYENPSIQMVKPQLTILYTHFFFVLYFLVYYTYNLCTHACKKVIVIMTDSFFISDSDEWTKVEENYMTIFSSFSANFPKQHGFGQYSTKTPWYTNTMLTWTWLCCTYSLHSTLCKNKLVVSITEWLPWLHTSWRDSGYERFTLVGD